jgi:hypothetical protein
MKKTILPQLKLFITNFCETNKIKNVSLDKLTLNTSIDFDLNIYDITMDLFISDFVNFFNIDYSNFTWESRGYPKDVLIVGIFRSIFGNKYKWVDDFLKLFYKPKIFIQDLQTAIQIGMLV